MGGGSWGTTRPSSPITPDPSPITPSEPGQHHPDANVADDLVGHERVAVDEEVDVVQERVVAVREADDVARAAPRAVQVREEVALARARARNEQRAGRRAVRAQVDVDVAARGEHVLGE